MKEEQETELTLTCKSCGSAQFDGIQGSFNVASVVGSFILPCPGCLNSTSVTVQRLDDSHWVVRITTNDGEDFLSRALGVN